MPEPRIVARAKKDLREGKKPSTAAGEFVRNEMDHIRQGKHGARNTKQAIAIGLSEARRAGVKLPPASKNAKAKGKKSTAKRAAPKRARRESSATRSAASLKALKREPRAAASHAALSAHAKKVAGKRR